MGSDGFHLTRKSIDALYAKKFVLMSTNPIATASGQEGLSIRTSVRLRPSVLRSGTRQFENRQKRDYLEIR